MGQGSLRLHSITVEKNRTQHKTLQFVAMEVAPRLPAPEALPAQIELEPSAAPEAVAASYDDEKLIIICFSFQKPFAFPHLENNVETNYTNTYFEHLPMEVAPPPSAPEAVATPIELAPPAAPVVVAPEDEVDKFGLDTF